MCDCRLRIVRLHLDGRHFTCAYCLRVNRHPFFELLYVLDGHAYCGFCGCFMKIENFTTYATEAESVRLRDEG